MEAPEADRQCARIVRPSGVDVGSADFPVCCADEASVPAVDRLSGSPEQVGNGHPSLHLVQLQGFLNGDGVTAWRGMR